MRSLTPWLCILPSLFVALICTVLSVLALLHAHFEDDSESGGCGIILAIFGVCIFAAIAVAFVMALLMRNP